MREKERKIIFLLFFLDRLSKYLFFHYGLFSINKGVSFGYFDNFPIFLNIFILVFFMVWFFFRKKERFFSGLVITGGVSNLLDRFIYKGVLDFIHLPFLPIFNLSDIFIVMGILIIAVDLLRTKWV